MLYKLLNNMYAPKIKTVLIYVFLPSTPSILPLPLLKIPKKVRSPIHHLSDKTELLHDSIKSRKTFGKSAFKTNGMGFSESYNTTC